MFTIQPSVEWSREWLQLFKFTFVIFIINKIGVDCTNCTQGFREFIPDNEEPTSIQDVFDDIDFDYGYYFFPGLNFQCRTRITDIYGRFMVDLNVYNLVYFQIWSSANLRTELIAELILDFTADYSDCTQMSINLTECLVSYHLPEDLPTEVGVGDFIGIYTFNNKLMRPFFNLTGRHFEPVLVLMSEHHQSNLQLLLEAEHIVDLSTERLSPQLIVAVDSNYITTPVDSTGNSKSESVIIIISTTVGIILLITTIVITALVVCKIRNKKADSKENMLVVLVNRLMTNPLYGDSMKENQANVICNQEHVSSEMNTIPLGFDEQLAPYVINYNDLHVEKSIAEGAFGIVYKGVYTRNGEAIDVAIKTLKNTSILKTEEFLKECNTTKQFNHPNIISLIGVSEIPEEGTPLMVLPYMHYGDVKSFVKSKRGNKIEVDEFPEDLSYTVFTKICLDIAKGMEYLSSLHFVHRDLAARNCMLNHCMLAKVADFGLSRDTYASDYYKLDHPALLPVKWLAPEALFDKCFTTKSDVWSFGVTCWEVFSLGLQPYPSVEPFEMAKYLKSGRTLDKPSLSSAEMYEIIQCCWKFSPDDRPTFSSLVKMIQQLNNENI